METNLAKVPLPSQVDGISKDVTHSVTLSSSAAAKVQYHIAKNKLLNINDWGEYAGIGSASFQLVDGGGHALGRNAQIGDFIKIEIPALSLQAGEGFDWVYIEKIEEQVEEATDSEYTLLQVRPTEAPINNSHATAHFFDQQSTSTFAVVREGLTITGSEHARNEKINTENGTVMDKVRNFFVALGAMIGLSDVQWKKLVRRLLS